MFHRGDLTSASVLCCGLFLAEDPGVIALRRSFGNTWPGGSSGIAIDLALGVTMVGYNYAASRYVVTVGEASAIHAAICHLSELNEAAFASETRRIRRAVKRLLRCLNPFNLINVAAGGFARVIERLRTTADRRAMASIAELLGELAAVNLLGVPGAGLQSVTRREAISRRTSLRHAVLFVASWFAGARLLGGLLDGLHAIPVAGAVLRSMTSTSAPAFDLAPDATAPVGAIIVSIVAVMIIRYSRTVERVAASLSR